MKIYKIAQYTLIETIKMQKEHGLPLKTMTFYELEEAKKYEKSGLIKKVKRKDEKGIYSVYVMGKDNGFIGALV